MKRLIVVTVVVAAALVPAAPAAPAAVSVSVDRTRVSMELGRDFTFVSRVVNRSSAATPSFVAHLNILSLRSDVYLDPEDWSSRRTRYLGTIPAGGSRRITWKVKAVNSGDIAIFVAVLPQDGGAQPPVNSATVHVDIAKRRTLNSGGILPLAAGIPAFLGLVALGVRVRRKRR